MKKTALIMAAVVFLTVLFSACNKEESKPVTISLGFINGNHSNKEVGDYPDFEKLTDNLNVFKTDYVVNNIIGVVPDGDPTPVVNFPDEAVLEDFNRALKNSRWDAANRRAIMMFEHFEKTVADDEEVDTLGAFNVISTGYEETKSDKRVIIVFDTGLPTCGYLSFIDNPQCKSIITSSKNICEKETGKIVNELKQIEMLPDLKGCEVHWYGIGRVGGAQPELKPNVKSNLKLFWKIILEKAGAEVNYHSVNKLKGELDSALPVVSTVFFDDAVALSESLLGFKAGTDEFLTNSEAKRKRVLQPFVSEGNVNGLLLVGTTSSDGVIGKVTGLNLSKKRADKVKQELVKLGVPADKIDILPLGTGSHKYNPNEIVHGAYFADSKAANTNRRVYIMLRDSAEAKQFKKDYLKINND